MTFDLLVTTVLAVRVLVDGELGWQDYALLYHQETFESREICERQRERQGDEIAAYLEESLSAYWMGRLDIERMDLRLDTDVSCFESL